MKKSTVVIEKNAEKQLKKAPENIRHKFYFWAISVEEEGIRNVRATPSWHDEPLKGERTGQRSIRLNKQWRAIYVITESGTIEILTVKEVTPHDY